MMHLFYEIKNLENYYIKLEDLQLANVVNNTLYYYVKNAIIYKLLFYIFSFFSIGLNASIPIFSSGLRKAKVSQAKINLLMINNTRELLDQQISLQERQARFNLNNLLEQYETQKRNVEISKEVFENMKLKFEQGIVSSLELTSANSNYMSAEGAFTNVLFQLLDAELTLRKINGKI